MAANNNDTPKWLDDLVRAEFDIKAGVTDKDKQLKNYFCVKCGGEAMTGEQMKENHERHSDVLRVRTCSNSYGLLQSDLQALEKKYKIDIIKGVAVTKNNSNYLILPKPNQERNPLVSSKRVRSLCVTCKRFTKEGSKFCSILCKLDHSRVKNAEAVKGVGSDNQERNDNVGIPEGVAAAADNAAGVVGDQKPKKKLNNNRWSHRKRARKAVHRKPERAPFR